MGERGTAAGADGRGAGDRRRGEAASHAARFFSTSFGLLGNLLVLTFLTLYLAASPRTYVDGLLLLVPPARRPRAAQVLAAIGFQLKWWLVGRLVAMASVGLIAGVGLWLIGVPQFLVLALVAALLTAIPFIGPILGAVPGVLVALCRGRRRPCGRSPSTRSPRWSRITSSPRSSSSGW